MKLANYDGRAVLVQDGAAYDVEHVSNGRFGPDTAAVLRDWEEFTAAASTFSLEQGVDIDPSLLGPPVAAPRQIFAIGLNYRDHAKETGMQAPDEPVVFTKFQSSIAGPAAEVQLPSDFVDWEAELVVVVGKEARNVSADQGWDHVAGLTAGQDYSERNVQKRGASPQFSLAKSFANFSPTGPLLVTPDEFPDRDAIGLSTTIVNGSGEQVMQKGSSADLIFDVPTLVAKLSEVLTLFPGDLIFTGTPAGVGIGRDPKVFLQRGWTVVTEIEGIGQMRNVLV
ncbi:fumarylacetoacetate hydrolase family protein [Ornithinimicrobium cavernae]|uniref:fumarylacetoacetate hydrolase family protein n=1 Tax=Ornithinimicrobium cavernae TaxID=2666047 RepID=UPI000D696A8B|nr:fumarylacetoacetate hydrolase family protein [Ornithinimicrobium cavernae]